MIMGEHNCELLQEHFLLVCGRVLGYQFGTPDASLVSRPGHDVTLENYYVDVVSVTYGQPRQHIWTFVAGIRDSITFIFVHAPITKRLLPLQLHHSLDRTIM